jgi:hypothetical protein
MKKILLLLWVLICLPLAAQVTTEPAVVTETSGVVKIFFDASQGNRGLMGFSGDVYAHTGVITDKSLNGSDWKYAPAWGDNNAKYKLSPRGNDLWELLITPDIKTYYGVPASEKVLKLAFCIPKRRQLEGRKRRRLCGYFCNAQ